MKLIEIQALRKMSFIFRPLVGVERNNYIHTYTNTFFGFFSIPQETCTHQQKLATQ